MTSYNEQSALLHVVDEGLAVLKQEYLTSAAQGKHLKLSVQSFTKRFNVSRSIIYLKYPHILKRIQDEFLLWQQASGNDKATVASLQSELRAVKAQAKLDLAVLAKMTLTDFVAKLGPSFRDAIVVQREIRQYLRKIEHLEQTVENQAGIIESLRLRLGDQRGLTHL